jgi:hypothetical protein
MKRNKKCIDGKGEGGGGGVWVGRWVESSGIDCRKEIRSYIDVVID